MERDEEKRDEVADEDRRLAIFRHHVQGDDSKYGCAYAGAEQDALCNPGVGECLELAKVDLGIVAEGRFKGEKHFRGGAERSHRCVCCRGGELAAHIARMHAHWLTRNRSVL